MKFKPLKENETVTKDHKRIELKKEGKYRSAAAFFIGGLIACIPIAGFVILLTMYFKAKDMEMRSYCEALLLLRPIVFALTILIYAFILLIAVKTLGIFSF